MLLCLLDPKDALPSSGALVTIQTTKQPHHPPRLKLQQYGCDNLKSRTFQSNLPSPHHTVLSVTHTETRRPVRSGDAPMGRRCLIFLSHPAASGAVCVDQERGRSALQCTGCLEMSAHFTRGQKIGLQGIRMWPTSSLCAIHY
jgi:hypothetical protein